MKNEIKAEVRANQYIDCIMSHLEAIVWRRRSTKIRFLIPISGKRKHWRATPLFPTFIKIFVVLESKMVVLNAAQQQLLGQWKLEKSENFDEYMKGTSFREVLGKRIFSS